LPKFYFYVLIQHISVALKKTV